MPVWMKQADMPHVQPLVVVQLMVLLGLANGTPVIAKKILGTILARPLDGGMNWADGQPLFGDSKTSDHLGRALDRSRLDDRRRHCGNSDDWRSFFKLHQTPDGSSPRQHGTWPGSDPGNRSYPRSLADGCCRSRPWISFWWQHFSLSANLSFRALYIRSKSETGLIEVRPFPAERRS